MSKAVHLETIIPSDFKGMRLDQALAKCFPDYSRAKLTEWIRAGQVWVNDLQIPPKQRLVGEEKVVIQSELNELENKPENIPLTIVFEDSDLLVINKPANLVVHPGAGNWQGTLLNALLHYHPDLKLLPRAGIIHRLDKDTTGLMVVAKTQQAYLKLSADLQERLIGRHYYALVKGVLLTGGTIDLPMGRHPKNRLKMAVVPNGKPAVTHYRIGQRFKGYTLLKVQLETGRTHQIRVHLSHAHYPLLGDPLYGTRAILSPQLSPELRTLIQTFSRPALHAYHLTLRHPTTQNNMSWEIPLPKDLEVLLRGLGYENHQAQLARTELGSCVYHNS